MHLFYISDGLTDSYTSTGTLSRILQAAADNAENNVEDIDEDEEEVDYYDDDGDTAMHQSVPSTNLETKEGGGESVTSSEVMAQSITTNRKKKSKGPRLDRILEDDDFIPELRLKNEHLLK
jgi:hypothetical protein